MNYLIPRDELEDPHHIPYIESPFMAACHVTQYVNGGWRHNTVGVDKARAYLTQQSQYRLEGWHLGQALIEATERGEWVLIRTEFVWLMSPLVCWFPDPREPQGGLWVRDTTCDARWMTSWIEMYLDDIPPPPPEELYRRLGPSYDLSFGLSEETKVHRRAMVAAKPVNRSKTARYGSTGFIIQVPKGGEVEPPFETGLGEAVDRLAYYSPSLQADLKALDKDDWHFSYGPVGEGSYIKRGKSHIYIDGRLKDADTYLIVQTLAHEVGHAKYPYVPDFSSKAAYINGRLIDEGAATLNNAQVRHQILVNGGPDIGLAGNAENHAAYIKAYERWRSDGNDEAAYAAIAKRYGANEWPSVKVDGKQLNYHDYYGTAYEKERPPQRAENTSYDGGDWFNRSLP